MMNYELVSLAICPYVQRVTIILHEKQQPFDIQHIDPYDPPAWFLAWSPTGKVPAMRVDEQHVLFESAVIMEYLEEVHPTPAFHSSDPLVKAQHRAWMSFSDILLSDQLQLLTTTDADIFLQKQKTLRDNLARIETAMIGIPFFGGITPCLVDLAIAPFFTRLHLIEKKLALNLLDQLPKMQQLSYALRNLDSVKRSVVSDFKYLFYERFKSAGGHAAQWL